MTNDRQDLQAGEGQQPAGPRVPLYFGLEPLPCPFDDDTRDHQVDLFVVGAARPTLTVAVVRSDAFEDPVVLRYERFGAGGDRLRQVVLDRVILAGYGRLVSCMLKDDGSAAEMWVSDSLGWLGRRGLSASDLAEVARALGPHVPPDAPRVVDMVCVRID